MKTTKLTIVLTLICSLLFGFGAAAQGGIPIALNTITRSSCLPGYIGCSGDPVQITLSDAVVGAGITKTFTSSSTQTYSIYNTRIKATFSTGSSMGTYSLPTVTGDQVVIPSTDGISPYTVIITKTGTRQFKLEVAQF